MADGDYIVADTDHTVVFGEADPCEEVLRRLQVFSIAPETLSDLVNLPAKTRPDLLAGRVVGNTLRFQGFDLGIEPLCSTVIHRVVREFGLDGCWRRRADDIDADIIETPRALITGEFPVIVYHGTSDLYLDDIKVQGLRVDAVSNWAKGGRDHVYLAAEAQVSAFHARRTANRVGGKAIVLKCRLPEVWAVDHDVKAKMVDNPEVPHSDERFLSQEAGLFAVPAAIPWAEIIEVRAPQCHTRFETWPIVQRTGGLGAGWRISNAPIIALIARLDREALAQAIAVAPLTELWPQALALYANSGSFRGSEANFNEYITPYTGALEVAGLDEVLDAIVGNGQNHAAAGTSQSLPSLLRNAGRGRLPSADARNRFFQMLLRTRRRDAFAETVALFETDGWIAPPRAPDEDD